MQNQLSLCPTIDGQVWKGKKREQNHNMYVHTSDFLTPVSSSFSMAVIFRVVPQVGYEVVTLLEDNHPPLVMVLWFVMDGRRGGIMRAVK